ncbi:PrkA family serine protein kinase [Chondromyces apiculatus]|uniref:Putative serine protein kinase, PrkA n=1 Tax=Chondromyces apiculatus DSM 436 TaxID=1192034 RepID=A0A017TH14_9BACT|nr:serine protein kinase PrkA [Chondromyces apiculatus]EYF07916.1 putative serine protein kinase, PrkA [Chondromyces apiculatus DSM 436]
MTSESSASRGDKAGPSTASHDPDRSVGNAAERTRIALSDLDAIASTMERRFNEERRVLSFQQYLELFASDPIRQGRDAARYVRDMFDHYGTRKVKRPWGELTRFNLFDLPWEAETPGAAPPGPTSDEGEPRAPAEPRHAATYHGRDAALIGQEDIQAETYRALCNFVREGRANRLILMHGPNGSAKSTVAACILRALEHYTTLDEGALYRFHWVFPSRKTMRGAIGFGGEVKASAADTVSYAHLSDDQIDSRLVIELRDHPLFLLPLRERRAMILKLYEDASAAEPPPEWLMSGKLSHKNQQVFEALLAANNGSLVEVLRHVQVERYFISRRYRLGAVTVGPALSVDAGERQITADRSLASLPTSLQATTLFEAHGELVEAAGGVLEFSDLLKRPIDAFRYLQLTLETGEVSLSQQTVQTNVVMIGSANEIHLAAFREHHEFPSFRGRFELIRAPYLRSWTDEQAIYDAQIVPFVTRHVAPHATRVAAQFAVLTRMRQPESKRYPDALAPIISALTAEEKVDLYATGAPPERLDPDAQKLLRASVEALYHESDASGDYEGRLGISPREVRTVLLDAAQSPEHACLSPFAVLAELDEICKRQSEFDWLKEKQLAGGYHDHRLFRDIARRRLLDLLEEEMRAASGLVEEGRYAELFDRYIHHVTVWVKGEKIRNPHTGDFEQPDERMMREVEGLLGTQGRHEDHRRGLISSIAAWAIDHPGEKVVNETVFPHLLRKLRDTVFRDRRQGVALVVRDLCTFLRDGKEQRPRDPAWGELREEQRRNARAALERLRQMGYCDNCALDAATALLRARYAELVT